MLQSTHGIVLRSVKYGESSLICTIFTRTYGVQAYLMQGVRTSSKSRGSRAGLLQPSMLLDLVTDHKPQKSLQRIREFTPYYFYQHLQEDIVRNSIALFSLELLLRLLPEAANAPELFDFTSDYFQQLDQLPLHAIPNFPVYFLIECGRHLGYEIHGYYSSATPYLNIEEGAFTNQPPLTGTVVNDEDAVALGQLLRTRNYAGLQETVMNAGMRNRILEGLLIFLHRHTQHMSPLKSLDILKAILH
jgi:DNA repair protein RecO (recombination protein O)